MERTTRVISMFFMEADADQPQSSPGMPSWHFETSDSGEELQRAFLVPMNLLVTEFIF